MDFYILQGPYRLGFGITGNYEIREKGYTGAWGGIAKFNYLFRGPPPHVKRLENIIKDMKTEWLDNDWTAEQLRDFVLQLIEERHLHIQQVR